ncbi:hypothetical protein BHE74_00049667 [Ensete ventricosum]|nr:hypothetical protein BHE74_00049667 [Ensete ventricosum]
MHFKGRNPLKGQKIRSFTSGTLESRNQPTLPPAVNVNEAAGPRKPSSLKASGLGSGNIASNLQMRPPCFSPLAFDPKSSFSRHLFPPVVLSLVHEAPVKEHGENHRN